MSKTTKLVAGALVAALIVLGVVVFTQTDDYKVKFALPSAAQLATGSPVLIQGFQVGKVSDLEARDGQAIVEVSISRDDAPLHEGTSTAIQWSAALGERFLTVFPGPVTNAEIPEGGLITGPARQIEVDQVLAAFDPPTRQRLSSLLDQLNKTTSGNEKDLQATLMSVGPTVQALGEVTDAVGKDGPAIKALVGQLHNLVGTAVAKQDKVRGFVSNVAGFADATAAQQQQLADGLKELPSTLDVAMTTLDKVRPATEATVPLLGDLRPGLDRLVGVSKDLSPLLHDLAPTLDRLVPTTDAAEELVGDLPGLLNSADDDLPTIRHIVHDYQPAAQFIRPYAPEIAGIFSNWGSTFGAFDSQGHYWPGVVAEGLDGFHDNVTRLPTETLRAEPKPGGIVGQPWDVNEHDATGDGPR